jgi:hypothetical protein
MCLLLVNLVHEIAIEDPLEDTLRDVFIVSLLLGSSIVTSPHTFIDLNDCLLKSMNRRPGLDTALTHIH